MSGKRRDQERVARQEASRQKAKLDAIASGVAVDRTALAPFIDYSRSEEVLTLSWDWHQKSLAVELLTAGAAELEVIATAEFSDARSTSDIDARLAPLMASVGSFLDGMRRQ